MASSVSSLRRLSIIAELFCNQLKAFPHRARSCGCSKTASLICSNQNCGACLLLLAWKTSYCADCSLLLSVSSYQKIHSYLVFKRSVVTGKSLSQAKGKECFLQGGTAQIDSLFQHSIPAYFRWEDIYLLKKRPNRVYLDLNLLLSNKVCWVLERVNSVKDPTDTVCPCAVPHTFSDSIWPLAV